MAKRVTMENKQEIIGYIRTKINARVLMFALETEFPAGHYHIKLYNTRELRDFIAKLNEEEVNRLFRDHDGVRFRPLTVAVDTAENREKSKNPLMFRLVHDMAVCEIYEQEGRISAKEVERITAEWTKGHENTRTRHQADVISENFGKIECKGMGGRMTQD